MNYKSSVKIYNQSLTRINKYLNKKKYDSAIRWMIVRANILYELQESFYDNTIENGLSIIGHSIAKQTVSNAKQRKVNIVFYDVVSKDRRGLSNQYLDALIDSGVDFFLITENNRFKETLQYKKIISCERASFCIVPSFVNEYDKAKYIYKTIILYSPKKVLCHLLPWSVTFLSALSALPNNIIKVNINITDHAYWAGSSLMDYNIEFRKFGKSISLKYRGFEMTQEHELPYYPYVDNKSFEGFDSININDRVILFWGGALYKVYGDNYRFLHLVAKILKNNSNCVCLCAGGGNANELITFIKKNNLENSWHYLGFRKDIYEVVKHCDIYLNTYPIGGGLMCQYAAINAKPVASFGSEDNSERPIESVLSTKCQLTFYDENQFFDYVSTLINNPNERIRIGKELLHAQITPSLFNHKFSNIINACTCTQKHGSISQLTMSGPHERTNYEIESTLFRNLKLKAFFVYPKLFFWLVKYAYTKLQFRK